MKAVISSGPMRDLLHRVERVAKSQAAVLITGETGSGKEVVARAIHHYSPRCSRPWIDVNCAALPDHLLESELFGYEKGAFSGAEATKQGLFEMAHGGTLFLDEIGELDAKLQVKLLRVLDGAPYYRLGGTKKIVADVRVVAATNRDLGQAVQQGAFRRDLYHRLDQVRLQVPPLRARRDDIAPLAVHFLGQEAGRLRFSRAALQALEAYEWPGNVRELRNTIVKAALAATGEEIGTEDLPAALRGLETARVAVGRSLEELEQQAILSALAQTGGRQDRAARLLGISQRTLIRKLKVYASQQAPHETASSGAAEEMQHA